MILIDCGERYALALLGREKEVNGNTQKVHLSKSMKFAVAPLVLTPFVPFRISMRRIRRRSWILSARIGRSGSLCRRARPLAASVGVSDSSFH